MNEIFETIPSDSQLRRYGKFLTVSRRSGYVFAKVDKPTDVEYITDSDVDALEELTRTQDWQIK